MKRTKQEWKEINDRIMYGLRPTQFPVAMKFIKTQEEFDAIPDICYCENKASVCKLISMAAYFQETSVLQEIIFLVHTVLLTTGVWQLIRITLTEVSSTANQPHGTMIRKTQRNTLPKM